MAMTFPNLDGIVRELMLEEFRLDVSLHKLYRGKRLTEFGWGEWPAALEAALRSGNDVSLSRWLARPGLLVTTEMATRNGQTFSRRVPDTAPITFAEGEFNRYYIRGVCRLALQLHAAGKGSDDVVVYRARQSENPRPESVRLEGTRIKAIDLLRDLRENTAVDGVTTALGLPPGPNSGLSVRLEN